MMSNRARHDIDWKALENGPTLAQEIMGLKVSTPTILVRFSTPVPHRCGRVIIQPDRFMYLEESFEAILEEHEIDPTYYNEVISSDDVIL